MGLAEGCFSWPMNAEMLDAIPVAIITTTAKGVIRDVNHAVSVMLGYAREELIGQSIEVLIPPRYRKGHPDQRDGFMKKPKERKIGGGRDLTAQHKDGSEVRTEIAVRMVQTEEGPTIVCCLVENSVRIADVEKIEEAAFFALHNPAPVLRVGESGTLLVTNPTSTTILGERCVAGGKLVEILPCFKLEDVSACLRKDEPLIAEQQVGERTFQFTMIGIPEANVVNVYGSDITKLTEVKRRLSHLARHDDLTQLPNRKHFVERLLEALWRSERSDEPVLLMYLDLDGFKQVNDTYGHEMGDVVLKETARRLKQSVRRTDSVFRLGGDEFAVILEQCQTSEQTSVADRICKSFSAPIDLPRGKPVVVGVSIGIATSPGCKSGQDLINQADKTMYRAKQAEGSCYRFYEEAFAEAAD